MGSEVEVLLEALIDTCGDDYYWAMNYSYMRPGVVSCSIFHKKGIKYGVFTGAGDTVQQAIDACLKDYDVKHRDLSESFEREG